MSDPDPVVLRARELFKVSGLTLDELGRRMGYEGDMARKSAWQLLNMVANPRVDSLRKFAAAIGVPIAELFAEEKKRKAK